jgi:HEAT repeat protein
MAGIMRGLTIVGILLATARGAEPDPSKEVIQDLKEAFKDGDRDAVTNTLTQAVELRWKVEDKKLGRLLRAIGVGIKHEDAIIASASIRTLVEMQVPGSSRYLNSRLAVPNKVGAMYWEVHLAAIRAAGELHELGSVSRLLKLVEHPKADMGAAAAEALGQYRSLVPKERKKLIRSVANALAKLEKKKPKGVQDKTRIERVTKTLIESVRSLSGDRKLATSRDVRLWLRKSGKPPSPGNTSAPK